LSSRGHTVFEVILSLALIGLLLSLVLPRQNLPDGKLVDMAARQMHRAIEAALAVAVAQDTEVYLAFDFSGHRYSIATASSVPRWTELGNGVLFGRGYATQGPFGVSVGNGPAALTCNADGCAMPGANAVAYFLSHQDGPAVSAVVISSSAHVQQYRRKGGSGAWQ
jgi:Tfp pilus assembly protein FimT